MTCCFCKCVSPSEAHRCFKRMRFGTRRLMMQHGDTDSVSVSLYFKLTHCKKVLQGGRVLHSRFKSASRFLSIDSVTETGCLGGNKKKKWTENMNILYVTDVDVSIIHILTNLPLIYLIVCFLLANVGLTFECHISTFSISIPQLRCLA